ncbi:hypothetical protein FGO68_gene17016 [Halteria grandinella]|uniref:Uncharacterized protein n=1 Tax=Halteria grandinella TaxID=5974 RepID=A0A8J8SWN9_HALGN|nr:hypothetical protein FGO68_gene17016 [Halteria grandinella]
MSKNFRHRLISTLRQFKNIQDVDKIIENHFLTLYFLPECLTPFILLKMRYQDQNFTNNKQYLSRLSQQSLMNQDRLQFDQEKRMSNAKQAKLQLMQFLTSIVLQIVQEKHQKAWKIAYLLKSKQIDRNYVKQVSFLNSKLKLQTIEQLQLKVSDQIYLSVDCIK